MVGGGTGLGLLATCSLGLLFGSFVGVLVSRVPAGEDVVRGRSRCDACGRTLGVLDLVPVLSWIVLRGRCRTCGARVNALWSVLEVLTAAGFALAWSVATSVWQAVLLGPFLGILLALSVIDVRTLRLPDAIVLPCFAAAFALIAAGHLARGELDLAGALVGAAAFGGTLAAIAALARRIYGEAAMGFGDVKLAALIGLVVGSIDLPSVAVAGSVAIILGGVAGVVALAIGMGRRAALPFGPMLCAGALVAVAVGPRVVDAYLGLYR